MIKCNVLNRMNEILGLFILTFTFLLLTFSAGRLFFIIVLFDYTINVGITDILTALWTGLRLSCQTAGILTLVILAADLISKIVSKIVTFIIFLSSSILYVASFPFYRQFHSNFNQMIFNAVNDDIYALMITFIDEFNLPLCLLLSLILSLILYKTFQKLKSLIINYSIKIKSHPKLTFSFLILNSAFCINLTVFGGGLNWQTELNFENIGITKDKFLNEAILDSYQAIYRGYVLQNRIASSSGLNFSAEDIKNLAAQHYNTKFGMRNAELNLSDNLDDYLLHNAKGASIPKPKHIFIIISESYANWTLLDKYSELHIADGMRTIINSNDSDYCPTFLPNGASTVSAVTGIVAGLADANLYLTTLPQSFENIYSTSAAPQMKRLEYETNFYYAGPSTWERIEEFTTAQGFDNFYSQGDIANAELENITGNVWGIDDKYLYEFVEKNLNLNTQDFNVILNTSNHAPYTVDLEAENIVLGKTFDDDELNKKLAHHLYADRELKNFIDTMKAKAPESLFIIIGDHADRCNIDKQPSDYERFIIPFIITGNGVHKDLLNKKSAGSQIDIIPTIIELIAPKDFEYYSIGTSLTENIRGVNYALFLTRTAIGNANVYPLKPEPLTNDTELEEQNWTEFENFINYVRGVSYWRAKFGNKLIDNSNQNTEEE